MENMSPIILTDDWTDWPTPSPTSQYTINVRFYSVIDDDDNATLRLDIGIDNEQVLEGLYVALGLANKGITPADFEKYLRNIYQTRLDASLPYTLQLAQYAVLTGDVGEVSRALCVERRSIIRTLRLLPFRILPQLVPRPTVWRERLVYWRDYALTRLRLVFMR